MGEGVAFEHRDEVGDGKHGFAEVEAGSKRAYLFGHNLVGFGGVRGGSIAFERIFMDAVEEVLPRDADICGVAMVGYLVDEDAKIVIGRLISVLIVKLCIGVSRSI